MNAHDLINEIIKTEGGFVDHPSDKGGPTNFGITLETLKAFTGKDCTAQDIRYLHKDIAIKIYLNLFYLKPKINNLPGKIDYIVMDACVNHGSSAAIKILQKSMNILLSQKNLFIKFNDGNINAGGKIAVDGINGTITSKTCRDLFNICPNELVHTLLCLRKDYYFDIVAKDKSQFVFLNGWINRIFKLQRHFFVGVKNNDF